MTEKSPLRVVIAGGGVAALERRIGLRTLASDRIELTLVARRRVRPSAAGRRGAVRRRTDAASRAPPRAAAGSGAAFLPTTAKLRRSIPACARRMATGWTTTPCSSRPAGRRCRRSTTADVGRPFGVPGSSRTRSILSSPPVGCGSSARCPKEIRPLAQRAPTFSRHRHAPVRSPAGENTRREFGGCRRRSGGGDGEAVARRRRRD
jgi:hypothetical protein